MSAKKILGQSLASPAVGTAAPTGTAGIDMTMFQGAMKARLWLVTVTIAVAVDDVFMWGSLPAGVADVHTDDVWGKYQDEYGTYPGGKLNALSGATLPVGTYHFYVDGLGLFTQVAFTHTGAGGATCAVTLSEVLEGAEP